VRPTACILVLTAAAGALHSASQRAATPAAYEDVRVYIAQTSPMSNTVWNAGEATASELFSKIGVRLQFTTFWRAKPSQRLVQLWILDRAPKNMKAEVLGAAFSSRQDDHPTVFIFYDRVIRFANGQCSSNHEIGVVLGYVIAHELGHALGHVDHSAEGVMKTNWTELDVKNMLRGQFAFNSVNSLRLRGSQATRMSLNAHPGVQ